eukprot:gene14742-biopygen15194
MVWIEARHLTESLMDRKMCRKLTKRWHGPVPAAVERVYSDLHARLHEADRGAPVSYRLALPPHWRIQDVFAQHRPKPHVQGSESFASRQRVPRPDAVIVDGEAEAPVEKILAHRVRSLRGKQIEEWKVRQTGYSDAHDQWRTREKMHRGRENQQLKEFEAARLDAQVKTRDAAVQRRSYQHDATTVMYLGATFAELLEHPCDAPETHSPEDRCLSWEHVEVLDDGEHARMTVVDVEAHGSARILVMFSGTGLVEREFVRCYPTASVVTLDHDPMWQSTHIAAVED